MGCGLESRGNSAFRVQQARRRRDQIDVYAGRVAAASSPTMTNGATSHLLL